MYSKTIMSSPFTCNGCGFDSHSVELLYLHYYHLSYMIKRNIPLLYLAFKSSIGILMLFYCYLFIILFYPESKCVVRMWLCVLPFSSEVRASKEKRNGNKGLLSQTLCHCATTASVVALLSNCFKQTVAKTSFT